MRSLEAVQVKMTRGKLVDARPEEPDEVEEKPEDESESEEEEAPGQLNVNTGGRRVRKRQTAKEARANLQKQQKKKPAKANNQKCKDTRRAKAEIKEWLS